MREHVGRIDCEQACEVPDGVWLGDVPKPRRGWSDVAVCPNGGCDRAFLVLNRDQEDV